MSPLAEVLVVGGGITGLAAAWECALAGAGVTLVEAAPALGGKLATEHVDGLLVEHGPDSFVAYRPAALALIDRLGRSDQVIVPSGQRRVHLRVDGRLLPLPEGMGMVLPTRLGPFVTTRILRPWHKVRAGADLVLPRRLGPADTSVGAFLRSRLGDGVVDRFAQPLVGGIYGAGVDDLSLDAVMPSLRDNERDHRSLMVASLAQGRAAARRAPAGGGSPFRSLADGMGSLVDALVASLLEAGAELRTGVAVAGLDRSTAGHAGPTVAVLSDGTRVPADAVVLAVGPAAMAQLLDDPLPHAARALREVPLSSSTIVTLAHEAAKFPEPPAGHGWLEAGPAPVSGVTLSSNKWAGRSPEGIVLLRAFVPGRLGPLGQRADAELVPVVADHVRRVMGVRGEPVLSRVTRWTAVMPTYTVGHPARAAAVDAAVACVPGWAVAGSALHGVGVPECIADGQRAARDVLALLSGTRSPGSLAEP